MADFYQSNSISTLHRLRPGRLPAMEAELAQFARRTSMSLVLPALITEFDRPSMRRIVDQLRPVNYYSNIVVAIGRATRKQVTEAAQWFKGFRSPVTILWMEDPKIQELLPAAPDGKGRTCWLATGYLLAEGHSDVIALHDCDIANYSREIPSALCYPLANPRLDFDFCKGYYARTSEKLHGRVTRLFLAPLLETLREHLPESRFVSFLSEFRYPLAGEFAMTAALARKVRMPADWGLEVGVLSEVFHHAGPTRVCQADIAENYDHKHQDLSPSDPAKGLRRMTRDIAAAMLRCLHRHGAQITPDCLGKVAHAYSRHAGAKLRQYEADALMNGLQFDRAEEIGAVNSFGQSLTEAIAHTGPAPDLLPAWGVVEWEQPALMRQLLDCPFDVTQPTRVPMPNWMQPVPKPALT